MLEMWNASEEQEDLAVLVGCSRCVSQKLRKHKDIGGLERMMDGKRILKTAGCGDMMWLWSRSRRRGNSFEARLQERVRKNF